MCTWQYVCLSVFIVINLLALVLLGRSCQLYEDLSGAQTHYERALQWMEGIGEEVIEELGGPAKSVLSDEYSFGELIGDS